MIVTVARKPLVGTVVETLLSPFGGAGALCIDACRIGTDGGTKRSGRATMPNAAGWQNMKGHGIAELHTGRWPANVLVTTSGASRFFKQVG